MCKFPEDDFSGEDDGEWEDNEGWEDLDEDDE